VFSFSGWVVAAWGVLFVFGVVFVTTHGNWTEPGVPLVLVVLWCSLLLVSALAFLVLTFGMAIFCAALDPSPVIAKVLWFGLFFFTAPFGSALYYFTTYRKLAVPREEINA
jgi:hypothetical protein